MSVEHFQHLNHSRTLISSSTKTAETGGLGLSRSQTFDHAKQSLSACAWRAVFFFVRNNEIDPKQKCIYSDYVKVLESYSVL